MVLAATIAAGAVVGMKYRMLNWDFQEIATGTVEAQLVIPADQPVFIIELTR